MLSRSSSILVFLVIMHTQAARAQPVDADVIQALRQQREEALDKVANAYVTIMKLQRELDRLKADQAKPPKANDAVPPQAPPPK